MTICCWSRASTAVSCTCAVRSDWYGERLSILVCVSLTAVKVISSMVLGIFFCFTIFLVKFIDLCFFLQLCLCNSHSQCSWIFVSFELSTSGFCVCECCNSTCLSLCSQNSCQVSSFSVSIINLILLFSLSNSCTQVFLLLSLSSH